MRTNTNMTVYNKYTNPNTKVVTYKRHLIDNVFWDDSLGVNLNHGYDNADKVNVYIPKYKNDMTKFVNSKQYNGSGWTLQDGDFMIKGNCTIAEVNGVKELSDYNVFRITVIDDKDFGSPNMQHFELRGN